LIVSIELVAILCVKGLDCVYFQNFLDLNIWELKLKL
jgi:hypothetical protein